MALLVGSFRAALRGPFRLTRTLRAIRAAVLIVGGWVYGAAASADNTTASLNGTAPPVDVLAVQGKLTESVQADSNPTLSTGKAHDLFGSVTSPEGILAIDTPEFHLDTDWRDDINRFSQTLLSTNDVHGLLHSLWHNEVLQIGLNGSYDYDTTRTSEETTSGIEVAGLRHEAGSLSPQIGYSLGPQDQLQISSTILDAYYANSTIYRNYSVYAVNPIYQHKFNDLNTGYITVQLSRYQTTTGLPQTTIDQLAPMVGWSVVLTPIFTASANVGVQRTFFGESEQGAGATTAQTGIAYNVDIGYKGQVDNLHLTSSRQPNPTGLGTESETTSIGFAGSHFVTPKFEVDANISYQRSSYGNSDLISQKYYLSASPRLMYHVGANLDFALQYKHREQAFTDTQQVAASNAVLFNIILTSDALSVR